MAIGKREEEKVPEPMINVTGSTILPGETLKNIQREFETIAQSIEDQYAAMIEQQKKLLPQVINEAVNRGLHEVIKQQEAAVRKEVAERMNDIWRAGNEKFKNIEGMAPRQRLEPSQPQPNAPIQPPSRPEGEPLLDSLSQTLKERGSQIEDY